MGFAMTRWLLTAALCVFAAAGSAQSRDGADTASDWRVRHYQSYGLWTSACDERDEDGALVQRCYIRWVDVFSPAPDFAALFVFVTADADGFTVDFGTEPGTLFRRFAIDTGDTSSWSTLWPGCLTGLSCTFTGNAANELLAAMRAGGVFSFDLFDRHGAWQELRWPLDGFDDAMADFLSASDARGLARPAPVPNRGAGE